MISSIAICFALVLVPNGGGQPVVLSGYDSQDAAEAAYKAADPVPPQPPCLPSKPVKQRLDAMVLSAGCIGVSFMPIFGRHFVFPAPPKDCARPDMGFGFYEKGNVWNRIRVDERGRIITSSEQMDNAK